MRRVLYSVAASLDGYIAGPAGEFDWIPEEPEIDWAAFLERFDTVLLGRGTYEVTAAQGGGPTEGMRTLVFSRSLDPDAHPEVEVVAEDAAARVDELRRGGGKDVWLMGGGVLFRDLLEAGVVDGVEIAVVPVLLGGGIPVLPAGETLRTRLELRTLRRYPSGIVLLEYGVEATP